MPVLFSGFRIFCCSCFFSLTGSIDPFCPECIISAVCIILVNTFIDKCKQIVFALLYGDGVLCMGKWITHDFSTFVFLGKDLLVQKVVYHNIHTACQKV